MVIFCEKNGETGDGVHGMVMHAVAVAWRQVNDKYSRNLDCFPRTMGFVVVHHIIEIAPNCVLYACHYLSLDSLLSCSYCYADG